MGLNNNVLHTIRQQMPQFSKGQKRIAAYILEHYDKAAFMTASRLGQTVEVSESTVVRFAAQLGYEGYPEMQRDLRELIRGKLTSIQRIQVSNDQMQGDLLTSVMQRDMDSLRTAIEQVDRGPVSYTHLDVYKRQRRFSLLPFCSIGAPEGLLLAVCSDSVQIGGTTYPRTLVALSPGPVSDGGGYQALWGGTERGKHEKAVQAAAGVAAQSAQAG